jgi:hypothetical protein
MGAISRIGFHSLSLQFPLKNQMDRKFSSRQKPVVLVYALLQEASIHNQ